MVRNPLTAKERVRCCTWMKLSRYSGAVYSVEDGGELMETCVSLDKQLQLETMRNVCVRMGTEVTPGYSTDSYFTAACREEWDMDATCAPAWELQAKIKALAARFPNVVCFSMDCYCTLIYVI